MNERTSDVTAAPPPRQPRVRSTAQHGLLGALSGLVVPLTALASGPILARALGVEGRGELASLTAPLFVAVFAFAMGGPEALTWALSSLRQPVRRTLAAVSPQVILQGSAATAVLWLIAPMLLRQSPHLVEEFRAASLVVPLIIAALYQRFMWSGVGLYALVRQERAGGAILRLSALTILFFAGLLTVNVALWTNLGTTLLMATALGLVGVRYLRRRGPDSPLGDDGRPEPASELSPSAAEHVHVWPVSETRRRIFGYTLRGWGGSLSNLITWRLDQVILVPLVSAASLGLYVVAVALAEIPMMAVNAIRSLVMAESGRRADPQVAARISRVVILTTAGFSVIAALAAQPFIVLFFGADFEGSVELARILLIGVPLFAAEQVLGAGLLALGRPGTRSIGQALAAGATLLGLLIAVPQYGVVAAAWTSLAAYTLTMLWTSVAFSRVSGVGLSQCLVPRPSDVVIVARTVLSTVTRRGGQRH